MKKKYSGLFLATWSFVCITVLFSLLQSKLYAEGKSIFIEFLKAVDNSEIFTAEEISQKAKKQLIDSKLEITNCEELVKREKERAKDVEYLWYVRSRGQDFVEIAPCNISGSVLITIYKKKNGGYVVGNTSMRGNHDQTQDLSFFTISENYTLIGKAIKTKDDLKKLGFTVPLANDFLAPEQYFPHEKNYEVNTFYMNEDGTVGVAPWTWMEPEWEFRNVIKRIWFEWNGEKFMKKVKNI